MGSEQEEQKYYKNLSWDLLKVEDDLMVLKKDMEDTVKTIDTSGDMCISRSKWVMEDKFKSGVKQITYGVTRLTNSVGSYLNLLVNEGIISKQEREQMGDYETDKDPGQKRKRRQSLEDASAIIGEFLEECRYEAENKQGAANAEQCTEQCTSWYTATDPRIQQQQQQQQAQSPRPRSPQYPPPDQAPQLQQQPMQYIQNIQPIPTLPLNGQQQAVQTGWAAPPSKQPPLEQKKKTGKKTKKNC